MSAAECVSEHGQDVGAHAQQLLHAGALEDQGEEGLGAHVEEGEHSEAPVCNRVVQVHKQGERQPDCPSQP